MTSIFSRFRLLDILDTLKIAGQYSDNDEARKHIVQSLIIAELYTHIARKLLLTRILIFALYSK